MATGRTVLLYRFGKAGMNRRTTLVLINLGHFTDHFFLLIYPTAVLSIHAAWDMTYGDALALATPGFLAFAAGTLPAGWLADRWSRSGMLAIFFLGIGVSGVATGLAPGPVWLACGLGAVGLFASIYHPVATPMIVALADRSGRALGINGVFGNLGVAAAAVSTGALTTAFGWRAAFIVPGLVAIGLGVVFCAALIRSPGKGGAKPVEAAAPRMPGAGSPGDPGPVRSARSIGAATRRVFAVVAVAALGGGLVFHGVTVALPRLFEERLPADIYGLAEIGALVSLVFGVAAFTQIVSGHLLDRHGARPVLLSLVGLQAPLLAIVAMVSGPAVVLLSLPLIVLVFGEIPVTDWLIGRTVPAEWHGRVYAAKYLLSLGVSAGAVPLIALLHLQTGGMAAAFVAMAGAAFAVFAVALLLPRGQPHTVGTVPAEAGSRSR